MIGGDSGLFVIAELFMLQHVPDLGQEVEDTASFHWNISNYRKLDKKVYSPEFTCGGHKWYVEVCPTITFLVNIRTMKSNEFTLVVHEIGELFSSHSAMVQIPRRHLFIWTTSVPMFPMTGTYVFSLRWLCPIPMIRRSISRAVGFRHPFDSLD